MTAKLLPYFMKCFDDQYCSVRIEACITSGTLAIQEDRVVEKIVHLATFDTTWKVKAIAIQGVYIVYLRTCGDMIIQRITLCIVPSVHAGPW